MELENNQNVDKKLKYAGSSCTKVFWFEKELNVHEWDSLRC